MVVRSRMHWTVEKEHENKLRNEKKQQQKDAIFLGTLTERGKGEITFPEKGGEGVGIRNSARTP